MAKFYNSRVKTGRLAGSVFAIRNGETIERAYQPVVYNPNTAAQVEARAKLKLLSQVSAVFSPYIAIPRLGVVSARNRFLRENYGNATYSDSTASFNLLGIKLTKSVVALSDIYVTRTEGNAGVYLVEGEQTLSRVVYILAERLPDSTMRVADSAVVSTPGVNNKFEHSFEISSGRDYFIVAYGVRDNTDAARARFGNIAVTAERVAQLIVSRTLLETDVTLTETKTAVVPAGQ